MKPPTAFQKMRMNRGFAEFVNDKDRLLAEIDCAELHVLRTLRKGEEEERYPAAERVADSIMRRLPPTPPAPLPGDTFFPKVREASAPEPRTWFSRMFDWTMQRRAS